MWETDLAGEGGDVEGGVALLGGGVDAGAPLEELADHAHVALLGGEVQRVQAILEKKRKIFFICQIVVSCVMLPRCRC